MHSVSPSGWLAQLRCFSSAPPPRRWILRHRNLRRWVANDAHSVRNLQSLAGFPRKWLLRRFDHSAIYLLIAATYTPFISQLNDASFAPRFLIGVWGVAFAGTVLKLNFPGRFDRVSIALYLVLGWSGAHAYDKAAAALLTLILALIVAGGGLYTMGVVPFVAASAFSECHMAWLCDAGCSLPFHCRGQSGHGLNGSSWVTDAAAKPADVYRLGISSPALATT